jgi:hypothetical protein
MSSDLHERLTLLSVHLTRHYPTPEVLRLSSEGHITLGELEAARKRVAEIWQELDDRPMPAEDATEEEKNAHADFLRTAWSEINEENELISELKEYLEEMCCVFMSMYHSKEE